MALTYESMLARYALAKHRAERISRERMKRAQALCVAAGVRDLGVAHNVMVSRDYGTIHADVDYSLIRQAFRVRESSGEPLAYLRRLWSALYDEWRAGGFAYDARKGS